jgi:hypothetical protein
MPDDPGCRSPSIRNDRCRGIRDEYYLAHLRPFEAVSFPSLGDHANGVPRSDKMLLRIRFLHALLGLAISFAVATFAQQKGTVDPETAQQVRALASNYDAAFNRQDAATVAGLYAEDAVFNTRRNISGSAGNLLSSSVVHKSWTRRQCPIVRLAFFQRPKKRMRSWLAALKFNA